MPQMSSLFTFVAVVLKDMIHEFWHFRFKYFEEYMVFVVKIFHPSTQTNSFTKFWLIVIRTIRTFVYYTGEQNVNAGKSRMAVLA
jgi:hypothetical protein